MRVSWWSAGGLALVTVLLWAGCEAGGAGAGDAAEQAGAGDQAATAESGNARQDVLNLYLTRQEYIEVYYGPGGRLAPEAEQLHAAVETSEARFHELMQLLGTDQADPARVEASVRALHAAHDRVLEEARAADVPLSPPDPGAVDGTPEGGLERWIGDIHTGVIEATGTGAGS